MVQEAQALLATAPIRDPLTNLRALDKMNPALAVINGIRNRMGIRGQVEPSMLVSLVESAEEYQRQAGPVTDPERSFTAFSFAAVLRQQGILASCYRVTQPLDAFHDMAKGGFTVVSGIDAKLNTAVVPHSPKNEYEEPRNRDLMHIEATDGSQFLMRTATLCGSVLLQDENRLQIISCTIAPDLQIEVSPQQD
jgi:hypothetical protein